MHNSNLAYNYLENSWNLPEWDTIVSEISNVFRLTEDEKTSLNENTTAKIIATIPFEAGCNNPERIALNHLCIYMVEKKGFQKYFSHTKEDDTDLFNRLFLISNFEGGNQTIIDHGMNMLALIMIEGYKRSMKKDKANKIYNPFVSGAWDYRSLKNKLLTEINKIEIPNINCFIKFLSTTQW